MIQNADPKHDSTLASTEATGCTASRRRRRVPSSWIASVTVVCFLFGGLMAAQLRAVEQSRAQKAKGVAAQQAAETQLKIARRMAEEERGRNERMKAQMEKLQQILGARSTLTRTQVRQLNDQINELQLLNGLTPVTGPGITVRLTDSANAAKATNTTFLPGLVHDYDLLQIVNELRVAKAEAIAIDGRRITGYSPIRCVGPVIHINWDAVAPPFEIEALGDAGTLKAAIEIPNGIADTLRNQGLGVGVTRSSKLTLPAVETRPQLRAARAAKVSTD